MKLKSIYLFSLLLLVFQGCNQPNYKKEAIEINNKGTQFFQQNLKDSALIYFSLATGKNPQYALAHQNKANALISLKQYDKAILAIDDLIKIQPYAEAFTIKGMLLDKTNKPDEAKQAYSEGLKKFEERLTSTSDANKSMIILEIGQLHFLKGDSSQAKTILEEHKAKAQDLGTADSILNNLQQKDKYIDWVLQKVG